MPAGVEADEEEEEAAGVSTLFEDAWCLWDLGRFEPSAGTSAAKVESSSFRFEVLASRWLGAGEEVRDMGGDMGRSGGRGGRRAPMICKEVDRESVSGRERAASRRRAVRRRRRTSKFFASSCLDSLLL